MAPGKTVPRSARRVRPAWAARFLVLYRQTGNVRLSATGAGVDRDSAYHLRQRDPVFAAQWQQAEQDAIDILEAEARRRALATSDTLLIFLLKAHRPEKYRDRLDLKVDVHRELQRIADELGVPIEEAEAEWKALEPRLLGRGS